MLQCTLGQHTLSQSKMYLVRVDSMCMMCLNLGIPATHRLTITNFLKEILEKTYIQIEFSTGKFYYSFLGICGDISYLMPYPLDTLCCNGDGTV